MNGGEPADPGAPRAHEEDPAEACTAVLMTVPYEVAQRLEGFLRANGVPCRVRKSDAAPASLAEEAMRSGSHEASETLRGPIGRAIKSKLKRDLSAEIEVKGSGFLPAYDVLVRAEDLPPELASPRAAFADPSGAGSSDALLRNQPAEAATASSEAGSPKRETAVGGAVAVTELPWNAAWDLVAQLAGAGIPAAVLETDASAAHLPMERRVVPVGVRPEDVERARRLIEP